MNKDQTVRFQFGMIGLGTMGRNLLLNMADHRYSVAGYDKNVEQVNLLENEADNKKIKGFFELAEFVNNLRKPRAIMILVPAGKPVDVVIGELLPFLEKGDLIFDGGNSKFTDTDRRIIELQKMGLHFFGVGISGGEEGARKGPSMMPGGDKQAYQHIKTVFEDISAKVNGEPCVTHIGPGAAGHFVKMVHNGIEYALMQLIAETYDILKNGLKLRNDTIHTVIKNWNEGRLQSFLLEITGDIFAFKDPGSHNLLLDDIKDEAKAKGTGKWTSQFAMDLQVPVPCIDVAVSTRDLSKYKSLRTNLETQYHDVSINNQLREFPDDYLDKLEHAIYFSMITIYAQGMHLLYQASKEYNYQLELDQIAKIWRGGCIIRAAFLEDIYAAFQKNESMEHLFLDQNIHSLIISNLVSARTVITQALAFGFSIPVFAASLNYFEAFRTQRMPTNLIQAQRDYFGAHTYELFSKKGVFHTHWLAQKDDLPNE